MAGIAASLPDGCFRSWDPAGAACAWLSTMGRHHEPGPSERASSGPFRVVVAAVDAASSRAITDRLGAREDIAGVHEVADAVAVTEAAVTKRPDFALVDERLPDLDDACRWIIRGADGVRLVLLRSDDARRSVPDAAGARCAGTPVPCTLEEFLASVEALRDGATALDPFAARIALATLRRTTHDAAHARPRLTEREWQVLRERARGTSLGELAREFFVSENTVRGHLQRIREKLLEGPSDGSPTGL